MAKAYPIKAQIREKQGTQACRALRRRGMLPGIIYGHKQDCVPVSLPTHEMENLLHHGTHLLAVDLGDNKTETVLIKDVQYDHLGLELLHVDLTRVDLAERVTVEVPLQFRGQARGVKEGGILQELVTDIEIECVVTEIPEFIRVDLSPLGLNQSLHAGDIKLPAGAALVTDAETVVVTIKPAVEEEVAEEAPEAAEGAEPEVIARGKEEAEE